MGINFSNSFRNLFDKKPIRIVMVGRPHSGKTTILYHLKLGKVVTTIPTVGFHLESLEYKKIRFNVWDVGGTPKVRLLWRHYFHDSQGIVFVIDCGDREIIAEVWDDLNILLIDEGLKCAVILVFANKQDVTNSMSVSELEEKLNLSRHLAGRRWHIQAASGIQGTGLHEGFDWLANELAKQ